MNAETIAIMNTIITVVDTKDEDDPYNSPIYTFDIGLLKLNSDTIIFNTGVIKNIIITMLTSQPTNGLINNPARMRLEHPINNKIVKADHAMACESFNG